MDTNAALQILALAMEREDGGSKFYLDAANRTDDAKGKKMFQWLAEEEKRHYNKLLIQHKELSRGGNWQNIESDEAPISAREFPSLAEAAGEVKAGAGDLDALQMGINAEKESIELYSKAAQEATDSQAKAMFLGLIEEEQGHLELLEAEHEWLAKSRQYFTIHRFFLPG
ncbi:ferritin family protein [Chloroflexota bacterium]